MTERDTKKVEAVAKILRVARQCDAPSLMEGEPIPCPFCHWGPDEQTGEPHEETGCYWFAEKIVAALRDGECGRTTEEK